EPRGLPQDLSLRRGDGRAGGEGVDEHRGGRRGLGGRSVRGDLSAGSGDDDRGEEAEREEARGPGHGPGDAAAPAPGRGAGEGPPARGGSRSVVSSASAALSSTVS